MTDLSDTLKNFLTNYCDVNAFYPEDFLKAYRGGQVREAEYAAVVTDLKAAIERDLLSPEKYKRLTGNSDFDTADDLRTELRGVLQAIGG